MAAKDNHEDTKTRRKPHDQKAVMIAQRRVAEEALAERSDQWPSTAERIHDARLRAGLTERDIAARLDIIPQAFWDLENYDDEAYKCVSLRKLATLGNIVGIQPRVLLFGDEAREIQQRITFQDIHERLVERISQRRITSEQFGDEVGWDVDKLMNDPEELWTFNVEGLYAACKALDLDWVAALPVI